jgi:hypothetical protein
MCRVSWKGLRAGVGTEPGLRAVPGHGSIGANTMRGVSGHRMDVCIQGDERRELVTGWGNARGGAHTSLSTLPFDGMAGLTDGFNIGSLVIECRPAAAVNLIVILPHSIAAW